MEIKNDMEHLVQAEVRLQRERTRSKLEGCWCSLCEADVHALALNKLPTRYCHQRNFGCAASPGYGAEVQEAVGFAIERVNRRPRHRPGRPLSRYDDIRIDNYAQKIGHGLIDSILTRKPAACSCDQCRADTLAYALNRYPPKYGVSYGGRASYQAHDEDFIRHEIGQALALAMCVVHARPHH